MVDIYKPEFSLLQQEILSYLMMKSGTSFNARKLANILNRTQTGIAKAIPELKKQDLIKTNKDEDSGRWSIEFNQNNSRAIGLKRAENLKMIYKSELIKFLEDIFPGTTIILFGSYSRGDDVWIEGDERHKSDIDIAIIGAREKEINLKKFSNLLGRNIILNFYSSFKEIHKHLKENILNGITLSGGINL